MKLDFKLKVIEWIYSHLENGNNNLDYLVLQLIRYKLKV